MSASFQVAVSPDVYQHAIQNLPVGWRIEQSPSQGPDGQMLVQVHDANAPEHLHGKRVAVTLHTHLDGSVTVTDYTVVGEQWQANRHPAEQAAVLARSEQVRDEFGDPLQVVAVSVRRTLEAATYAAEERQRLRARVADLEELADEMLRAFSERGHPGTPCIRSGWVREDRWRGWHRTLEGR